MDAKSIGVKIADLRKKRGYTQAELADKIGVTNKAVSKWERGVNFPDMGIIDDLAETLGTTTAELLEGEEERPERYKFLLTISLAALVVLYAMMLVVMDDSKVGMMIMFISQMVASVGLFLGMMVCKKMIWGNRKDYDTNNILLIDIFTIRNFLKSENEEEEQNRNVWPMVISTAILLLIITGDHFYFMEGMKLLGYYLGVALMMVYFIQLIQRYDIGGKKLLLNSVIMVVISVALLVLGMFIEPELYAI